MSIQPLPSRPIVGTTSAQRGATLIELMVGITIGLMTVLVGMGALMVSRSVSGTLTDATKLQQQATYAFRVIGQQLRQAGARPIQIATGANPRDPAQLVQPAQAIPSFRSIEGKDTPSANEYTLSIRYLNDSEMIYPDTGSTPVTGFLMADCLGNNPGLTAAPLLVSEFKRVDDNLVCAGSGGSTPQPIITGVKDFRVTYLQQNFSAADQQPVFRYASASNLAATDWPNVIAVEICLELEGELTVDTAGATYTQCDGTVANRNNRLRMVFRNLYQIRALSASGT